MSVAGGVTPPAFCIATTTTRGGSTVKGIRFDRDLRLDGRPVKAGDVLPLAGLPADHVESVVRLGYAAEVEVPEPKADDEPKQPARPAKK